MDRRKSKSPTSDTKDSGSPPIKKARFDEDADESIFDDKACDSTLQELLKVDPLFREGLVLTSQQLDEGEESDPELVSSDPLLEKHDAALAKFHETMTNLDLPSCTREQLQATFEKARDELLHSISQLYSANLALPIKLNEVREHVDNILDDLLIRLNPTADSSTAAGPLSGLRPESSQGEPSSSSDSYASMEQQAHCLAMSAYRARMDMLRKDGKIYSERIVLETHRDAKDEAEKVFKDYTETSSDGANYMRFDRLLRQDIQVLQDKVLSEMALRRRTRRTQEQETVTDKPSSNYAIGIDLGTTHSCVSVFKDGHVLTVLNNGRNKTTPSVVYFGAEKMQIGEMAKSLGYQDPANCICEMKRIIGRKYKDSMVKTMIKKWPFQVDQLAGFPVIKPTTKIGVVWTPVEIVSCILSELKKQAEVQLGGEITDAVVTIPAYFTEPQRDATMRACKHAGLNVLRLLNEPTAAAIAYGLHAEMQREKKEGTPQKDEKNAKKNVLVFDFGGGTCDVSILEMRRGELVVRASQGDNQLGGEDYDEHLMEYLVEKFEQEHEIKVNKLACRNLRDYCEIAKCLLTDKTQYRIKIRNFVAEIELDMLVTREMFDSISEELNARAMETVKKCLKEASMQAGDIDEVVLAGGSSRMPRIQYLLRNMFPHGALCCNIDPDLAISHGAALLAAQLTGHHTDSALNMRITDITPFSLGLALFDGSYCVMLPKNSTIPCSFVADDFSTTEDNQEWMEIRVYQGEHTANEKRNTMLGNFKLTNLRRAPAGHVGVKIGFHLTADGVLRVDAEEIGKKQNKKTIKVERKFV